jgi:regulator of replication initiation timing
MAKCGDMQQMAKSEETSVEAKAKTEESKEEVTLVKSENETLKKENEDLKKNMESLIVSMNKFLSTKAPERKAVTDISFIAKSEEVKPETKPLSKSDINGILSKKTQDASLSKSDRELINNYYLNNAAIDTVSHLLK